MMKWINHITSAEYTSEDEARDAAAEMVDDTDLEECIGINITFRDIIKELARLESPLYYELISEACERVFEDFFYTIDEEEDEE